MTTYYFEFQAHSEDRAYEYNSYRYEVEAENYEQALEKAQALQGNKPYHSTNCTL